MEVLKKGRNIKTDRPTSKFEDKRLGPFEIIKKVGAGAYKLKLPKKWKGLHPVFNEVLLHPYHEPQFKNQEKNTEIPDIINAFEKEPEEILNSRERARGIQYLVRWKNKPRSEDTWEPRNTLIKKHQKIIENFHKKNPDAARMPVIRIPPQIRQNNITYNNNLWDQYENTWNRWKEREQRKQLVVPVDGSTLEQLRSRQVQSYTLPIKINSIDALLLQHIDNKTIAYAAKISDPERAVNGWKYPITSFHELVEPLTLSTHLPTRITYQSVALY